MSVGLGTTKICPQCEVEKQFSARNFKLLYETPNLSDGTTQRVYEGFCKNCMKKLSTVIDENDKLNAAQGEIDTGAFYD
jgi:hypothetical protein